MAEGDNMGGLRDRDLVLPPGTYAYVLDSTKGKVSVLVGPTRTTPNNTDKLVVWDQARGRFNEVIDPDAAISVFQQAREGEYIILTNPAPNEALPMKGTTTDAVELEIGRQVNMPGPASFPLWPGQSAQTILGHHLRHNQYLIVRVYDPEAAAEHWQSAVVATQGDAEASTVIQTQNFAMGQLLVIKGTEVAFYIPPTGVEVVPEGGTVTSGVNYGGQFVREAVTLERLEYCILLDEDGEKRYVQGPDVVFPEPTEQFVMQDGLRKFTAIELNPHSGLFIKVIAEYEDEDGTVHPVGEELFITGNEMPIYFPRPEHSIIQYGNKRVHHAVAIPAGEGRYVLDRDNGTVDLVVGPKMFLPDPRHEVVVLRILDPHIVELLYPGNREAMEINERYMAMSTRLGAGQHLSNEDATIMAASVTMDNAIARGVDRAYAGDAMKRGTQYTPPRTIVLDTKYEGAVTINIWPGYAVLVTDKSDNRRVEVGPKSVLLQYDEMLMPLTLSTGTPKNDANLLRTGYLRIVNNQVSDSVMVETRDLVQVRIDVSYRVNFEGTTQKDQQRWFAIENYVKVLTDHCRSRLRNEAKRHGIQDFYTNTIDIIRDTLLGAAADGGRQGLAFDINGMRLYDVEVLGVTIDDGAVGALMVNAQTKAITGAIELSTKQEDTERFVQLQSLERQQIDEAERTTAKRQAIVMLDVTRQRDQRLAQIQSDFDTAEERAKILELDLTNEAKRTSLDLEMARERLALDVERLVAETEQYLRRVGAIDDKMVEALRQFGEHDFVSKLVEAVGPAAMAAGVTAADLFGQMFKGTPFEGVTSALTIRPLAIHTNGHPEAEHSLS